MVQGFQSVSDHFTTLRSKGLISAKIAIKLNRNRSNILNIFESKSGPEYKQSFKDGLSDSQDASNTDRILVVSYFPLVYLSMREVMNLTRFFGNFIKRYFFNNFILFIFFKNFIIFFN